jgi:hypothetical protein
MEPEMSDDQFTELKKYLDERFDDQDSKVEKRLAEQDATMDTRFADQDAKFDDHLNRALAQFAGQSNQRFSELEAKIDAKADRQDLDRIYDALDAILKNQETEQQERAAMNHQLDRHERWHHQTADTLHLKLDY